jgi:hypothetical protein
MHFMLPSGIRRWWREGEEDVVAIYRRHWLFSLTVVTGAFACLFYIFYIWLPDVGTNRNTWKLLLLAYVATTSGILLLARRAIIITRDALISRPAFGDLDRVPFASIVRFSVAPPSLATTLILYALPTERLKLDLRHGGEIYITLDVRGRNEILLALRNRISAAAPRGAATPPSGP